MFVSSSWTVNGDLTLVSGMFSVAGAATYVVSVSGNATFSGGTFATPFAGTIDVAGHVTFSGTACTGLTPTIRCGGTWTSNAAYAPTTGNVVLDGVGAQSILGNGMLPALTIAATSSATRTGAMTLAGGLTLDGSLAHSGGTLQINGVATVNGTLSMPSATLDANGHFTVAATGSVNLGAGTHTFGANYTGSGSVTATGLFVFDSSTGSNVLGPPSLPSVQIAKSSGASILVSSSWTVNGDLTLISGAFLVAGAPDARRLGGGQRDVLGRDDGDPDGRDDRRRGERHVLGHAGHGPHAHDPLRRDLDLERHVRAFDRDRRARRDCAANGVGRGKVRDAHDRRGGFGHEPRPAHGRRDPHRERRALDPHRVARRQWELHGVGDGAANLGSGTHTFAMNYTVAGSMTASGMFIFDSTNTATGITVAPFPSIEIAKSGAAPLIVGSAWTVNGNLALISGGLSVSAAPGFVVSVLG